MNNSLNELEEKEFDVYNFLISVWLLKNWIHREATDYYADSVSFYGEIWFWEGFIMDF